MVKDTPTPERVSVPQASPAPLSLAHLMMVDLFLFPSYTWHRIHAKADAMDITRQVTPFMEWLTAETGEPQQGITSLNIMDLTGTTLDQSEWIQP